MKIFSWNYRGLGNLQAVQALDDLIRQHQPDIVFLIETLVEDDVIVSIRDRFRFEFGHCVKRIGRSGGLAFFSRFSCVMNVLDSSQNFVDVEVKMEDGFSWFLTCFYGFPERFRRSASWDLLRSLRRNPNVPWLAIGDFNDLASSDEKLGGLDHPTYLFNGFRNTLQDCDLHEVEWLGYSFTWEKSRGTPTWVREKLDRAVANSAWFEHFDRAVVKTCVAPISDHSPLILNTDAAVLTWNCRRFRFESKWLRNEELTAVVEDYWSLQGDIMVKKQHLCTALEKWGRDLDRAAKSEKKRIKRRLEAVRSVNTNEYNILRSELAQLLDLERIKWKQRAKEFWLEEGDLNSKYFHLAASTRKRKNTISELDDGHGNMVSTRDGIHSIVRNYFEQLYVADAVDFSSVTGLVTLKVTARDNVMLLSPFDASEFKNAVFSMHPDKASGPDGLNPAFFQKFWHRIGETVIAAANVWLIDGHFPPSLSDTFIVLIPKVEHPTSVKDLRPISLCNVLYKIVAKVLANRLKVLLPRVVSDSQSAFIKGRLITDNILVAFELIHYMKHRTRRVGGDVALKIDISKAYDRIDWGYLEGMMLALGFDRRWISLIMMCVRNVSSVSVNGYELEPIISSRGLRQGDPLSQYLYVLCAEGLSTLLSDAERRGVISGISICLNSPSVSHLLFADDSFLFFKATEQQCHAIRNILYVYEHASGQAVNLRKSGIFFGSNVFEVQVSISC